MEDCSLLSYTYCFLPTHFPSIVKSHFGLDPHPVFTLFWLYEWHSHMSYIVYHYYVSFLVLLVFLQTHQEFCPFLLGDSSLRALWPAAFWAGAELSSWNFLSPTSWGFPLCPSWVRSPSSWIHHLPFPWSRNFLRKGAWKENSETLNV